jgi:cytochrome P450
MGRARSSREAIIESQGRAQVSESEIPKGSLITVSSYALQRDRRFFPEPEQFNPDRFAPGWEERISRFAYLPFGRGPCMCIGNGFAMMEPRERVER